MHPWVGALQVAKLFAEGAPSELVLPNCTQVDAAWMSDLLREACTPKCAPVKQYC